MHVGEKKIICSETSVYLLLLQVNGMLNDAEQCGYMLKTYTGWARKNKAIIFGELLI